MKRRRHQLKAREREGNADDDDAGRLPNNSRGRERRGEVKGAEETKLRPKGNGKLQNGKARTRYDGGSEERAVAEWTEVLGVCSSAGERRRNAKGAER